MDLPDPIYSFRGKMDRVLCLLPTIESGLELLHVGTCTGFVHVWDLQVKREVNKVEVGKAPCASIIKVPQGFVTLSRGEAVRIWGSTWDLTATILTDYCGFSNVVLAGSDLFIPATDGRITVVNMSGETLNEISAKPEDRVGELMCMKYLTSRDVVVACFESNKVRVLRRNGQVVCSADLEHEPICLDVSEKSSEVLVGTSGFILTKFTFTNDCLTALCSARITNPGFSSVSIRPDSKLCVAGCWDKKVRYFSMKHLKLLAALDLNASADCVAFGSAESNEPGLVYVGDSDGRVTIWNLYANKM